MAAALDESQCLGVLHVITWGMHGMTPLEGSSPASQDLPHRVGLGPLLISECHAM